MDVIDRLSPLRCQGKGNSWFGINLVWDLVATGHGEQKDYSHGSDRFSRLTSVESVAKNIPASEHSKGAKTIITIAMEHFFLCPYCGEEISMVLDTSVTGQTYVEDCEVCC